MTAVAKPKKHTKTPGAKSRFRTATAIVGSAGNNRVVGLGNLRVIICEENGIWFAQCLEIDYAANGNSLDEVKANFEHGLSATIELHLRAYNTIEKMLTPAPPDVWKELAKEPRRFLYGQVSKHPMKPEFEHLPYTGISYIQASEQAAA